MIEAAVEEFLRYDSPIQSAARIAMEDVELGGQRIDKGQRVTMIVGPRTGTPCGCQILTSWTSPEKTTATCRSGLVLAFVWAPH